MVWVYQRTQRWVWCAYDAHRYCRSLLDGFECSASVDIHDSRKPLKGSGFRRNSVLGSRDSSPFWVPAVYGPT